MHTGPDVNTLALCNNGDLFGASYQALFRINPSTGSSTFIGGMGFFVEPGFVSAQFDNNDQLFLIR